MMMIKSNIDDRADEQWKWKKGDESRRHSVL